MNTIHSTLAVLSLGLLLSAHTCSDNKAGNEASASSTMATIAEGKWALRTLGGKALELPEGLESPYLTLDPAAGTVSGYGGCNRLMGSVKVDGDSISFPALGSTKMYCERSQKIEDGFKNALSNARTYTLKGDHLTLLDGRTELATLEHVK